MPTTTQPRADVCTPRPARAKRPPRAPALAYPDLPDEPYVRADFWRAVFLRELAEIRAAEAVINSREFMRKPEPFQFFMYGAHRKQVAEVRKAYKEWQDEVFEPTGSPRETLQ